MMYDEISLQIPTHTLVKHARGRPLSFCLDNRNTDSVSPMGGNLGASRFPIRYDDVAVASKSETQRVTERRVCFLVLFFLLFFW